METSEPSAILTQLTPSQRRRRVWTFVLIAFIALMIAVGRIHPFFKLVRPEHMTRAAQKALAVKGIMVMGYWTVCFLLAVGLLLLAWMEFREVQRKALIARRDVWRDLADRTRGGGSSSTNG